MNMEIGRYVQQYVEETRKTLEAPYLLEGMRKMVPMLLEAREKGRTIYFFGNGGSASTASHFVCDIGKGTNQAGGKRFKCHALNDSVTNSTAWANDTDYSRIFSEPIATLGRKAVGMAADGWTIKSLDGSLAAQFEHTVLVTEDGFEIVTTL